MSDFVISIYIVVLMSLATLLVFHAALRHRRIVSSLTYWALIGVFLSSVGGLLLLGTFNPDMANYSARANDLYNAFTWGGIDMPGYSEMIRVITNMGIVINAMGLGVLILDVLSGLFPKSFFLPVVSKNQTQPH